MNKYSILFAAICVVVFPYCKTENNAIPETMSTIKYFSGGMKDKVESIEKTADGGFIYCGSTLTNTNKADAFMLKVDGDGKQQWYKTYGGKYFDIFRHCIQTSDGGFLGVGFTKSFGRALTDSTSANYSDYIIKTDANGNIQWMKSLMALDCEYKYVCENSAHEFLMTGYVTFSNDLKICVTKLNSDGGTAWIRFYDPATIPPYLGINYNNSGMFVSTNSNNDILICGDMPNGKTAVETPKRVPYFMRLDNAGNAISFIPYFDYIKLGSAYRYNWPEPYGKRYKVKIINLSDGYLMATYTEDAGNVLRMELIKVDLSGVAQWEKTYSGLGYSVLHSIESNPDGSYLLVGMSSKDGINGYYPELFANLKIMLLKVDAKGNEIWTKYIGSDENVNSSKCVRRRDDGGYTLAGYTCLNENGYDKMYIMEVDENGNVLQ